MLNLGREDAILARARAQVPPEMGDAACELLSTAIRLSRAYQEEILRGYGFSGRVGFGGGGCGGCAPF